MMIFHGCECSRFLVFRLCSLFRERFAIPVAVVFRAGAAIPDSVFRSILI